VRAGQLSVLSFAAGWYGLRCSQRSPAECDVRHSHEHVPRWRCPTSPSAA